MKDPGSAPTLAADEPPLSAGWILADRYIVRARLGAGAMGAVYRVLDRELDEEVAMKILLPEIARRPEALVRFRREVKLARRVTHPNVARTFDLGSDGETRFLTMELIGGEPLSATMRRGAPSLANVLRIAAEVARGLSAAHAVGVVHRDLKPDNILCVGDRVVLTDFGIASLAEGLDVGALQTGAIVGTPAYMAPEQLEGRSIDGRTDVYALGILMFEMIVGELPFEGGVLAAATQRLMKPAPDPRARVPSLPEPIAKVVRSALERERDARPDAGALLESIDRLRGGGAAPEVSAPSLAGASSTVDLPMSTATIVGVADFESPASAPELGADLGRAIADTLAKHRALTVIPRFKVGAEARATIVVEGSVRVSGARVRVRARVIDPVTGNESWAALVEGTTDDVFDLEDRAAAAVASAVRSRTSNETESGPADAALRARFADARLAYERFTFPDVERAIEILNDLMIEAPDDPHVLSLLAASLVRRGNQAGTDDIGLIAKAEDLALRSLSLDPTIAGTHLTLALLRSRSGEYRAAVRACREALTRAPRFAGAHEMLGLMLVDCNRIADGRRHLELAARLEPRSVSTIGSLAVVHALIGEREAALEWIAKLRHVGGPLGGVVFESRIASWWRDKALALDVAERIEAANVTAAWRDAATVMRAFATGTGGPEIRVTLAKLVGSRHAAALRCRMTEIAIETLMLFDDVEAAGDYLETLVDTPFTDLLWLERCPSLDGFRDDPRYLRVRAATADRARAVWS